MTSLAEKEIKYNEAGFTQKEIADWKKEKVLELKSAGFNNQEIQEEFGVKSNNEPFIKYFQDISKEIQEETMQSEIVGPDDQMLYDSMQEMGDQKSMKEILVGKNFDGDAILKRGWGKTLYDMTYRLSTEKGLPEAFTEEEPEDYTWFEGLLERGLTLGAELPIYGASYFAGGGNPISGAFTAGAIPGAARATILKGLEQQSYGQPVEILKNFLQEGIKEGVKQGTVFATTALAPQLRIPGVGKLADQYLTRVASQLTAFEGTGAILNQQLPSLKEFSYSAVLFGGLGLVQPRKTMEDRTKKIFVDTGKKPNQVFIDSISNKTILEDVSSRSYVRAYKGLLDRKTVEKKVEAKQPETLFKDDLANKASENIVFKPKVETLTAERLKEMGSKVKKKAIIEGIDNKYPILEALRKAGVNTKTGIEKLNIYEQARILEGIPNRAAYFIENNTINFKNLNDKGAGLKTVVKDVIDKGKTETQLFETYLMNRRAVELNNRGIETGFNIQTAKDFIKQYKSQFEQIAKKTDTYQRELLEYAKDGGFITAEAFTAMTEANKNYVTYARELIGKDGKVVAVEGSSTNPLKEIKGSKLRVFPPLEQMVKNTNTIVNLVERNNVKVQFIDKIVEAKKKDSNLFPFIEKVNPTKTNLPKSELLSIRRNGKLETWSVGKDLVNAFKTLDQQGANMLINYLGAPARTLRAGAILIPDFAVPNFFRDTMQASFLNKVGFVPIQDSLIGMFNIITRGRSKKAQDMYNKYVKSGGMQSTLLSVDRPNLFDGKVYDILSKGPVRNADRGMLAPFRALTRLSEEMTRFRIFEKTYRKAIDKGLTERQALERAGFEARNLLDYAKRGTLGNNINRLVPFWNARVQGLTRLYEAFRDQPGRTTAMIGAYVVIPTLGFYMLNKDDPDYKEQPDWLKQAYYYFKIGDKPYRFPKPFEVGTLVSSMVEKTLDWVRTNEPQEFARFAEDFFFSNAKGFYPFPTALRPFAENFMNYSFFREAPLVPRSLDKNLPNKFYYTEYTSETFKLVSKLLNDLVGDDSFFATNPIHAENVFRSWTGGIGRYIIDTLDYVLIKGEIIDDPIKPTDTLSKIPVVRAFDVRDVPGYSAKSIVRFFEEYKKVDTILNGMDFARKNGDFEEYRKLKETLNLDETLLVKYRQSIKDLDKQIRAIYNLKKFPNGEIPTPDEKRELIDDLYKYMINFAQQGLTLLENAKKK
jgi:predicted RNA-binding protein Jag